MKKKRIVAAMSGGVDSSVAAALLAEQGWEVVGVTMKLLARADTGFGCCGSPADVDDAKRCCEKIGISHYTVDMADLFARKVIAPFVNDYLNARTPNPCVECNRSLKFGHLLALAESWDCEAVATGHYARAENGRLLKAKDEQKDQTYFLYSLTSKELGRVRFPIGELTKPEVREKARALGLVTSDKPESQEICFVPRRDYRAFLEGQTAAAGSGALAEGSIRDADGREVGRHAGVAGFTVGQRKGLGAAGAARYVVALEPRTNTVVVGGPEDVFSASFTADGVTWTGEAPAESVAVRARIRHRHVPAPATLWPLPDNRARVEFERPQRAVTPGQACVFYRDEQVLGGGIIAARGARAS
jgi:tRNA-uridine 2-sulfurtransferase